MGLNRFAVGDRARRLPGRSGLTALLPTTVALVSLASLLLLVQTSRVTSAGYDIERLQEIREEWKQKNYQLEYEIDALKALPRIEQEAVTRLNMTSATQYVYLKVDMPSQAKSMPEIHPPTYVESELENKPAGWWGKLLRFFTLWKDIAKST
ncbi:MAG: hypothetical protein A2Y60_01465 [Chloroflexi bacterium RBG_13_54_9]|nr:MAG: hypothetical protein A2Y60_01465 [Chloroflexi bacterium RBG_13_54_9]